MRPGRHFLTLFTMFLHAPQFLHQKMQHQKLSKNPFKKNQFPTGVLIFGDSAPCPKLAPPNGHF